MSTSIRQLTAPAEVRPLGYRPTCAPPGIRTRNLRIKSSHRLNPARSSRALTCGFVIQPVHWVALNSPTKAEFVGCVVGRVQLVRRLPGDAASAAIWSGVSAVALCRCCVRELRQSRCSPVRLSEVGVMETVSLVVSVEEAAGLLGISRGLAYELVRRGELPSIRLGRRLVVPRRRLLELVDADRAQTG